jgi:hypothetical protein
VTTSAQILAVLQDIARHQAILDPEADEIELTMQTTVAQWRVACDLLPWRALYPALEQRFGVAFSDSEWERVLEPARRRTMEDVCGLLAQKVQLPSVRAWQGSRAAGAFLLFRRLLGQRLAPHTPLAPLLQSHAVEILLAAGLVAPGKLPTVSLSGWWHKKVELPGLSTFADLARCLSEQ